MLTEIIELPSKGNVYPKESPLSSGKVEIKYMTAKEEDILSTQTFVKEGIVLDKLLESVIVSKIDPKELIAGDKNKILLATRILAYGQEYEFLYDGEKHKIDLNEIQNMGDPNSFDGSRTIDFELPKSKSVVTIKLLNGYDSQKIDAEIKSLEKAGIQSGYNLVSLYHLIQSVDGNEDISFIRKFVSEDLLAMDSLAIRMFLKKVEPDIKFSQFISGREVDVPIGINFFYPTLEV